MWVHNCGMLPVVGTDRKLFGIVTDRDICIAMGTRNQLPGELTVGEIATRDVFTCKPDDEIHEALDTMANKQVRGLPVVNGEGVPQGILSMDDIVTHGDLNKWEGACELSSEEIIRSLKKLYARSSRWFIRSLPQPDLVNQFHSFRDPHDGSGASRAQPRLFPQQTVQRRCGAVHDELRTQLARVFPRWIVLLFVDSIPATQLASVLSRLTPTNDLRSGALFLSPHSPAFGFLAGRRRDLVLVLIFIPSYLLQRKPCGSSRIRPRCPLSGSFRGHR